MHLLLQRSAAQEQALQKLMDEQLDPKSSNYHAWLTPQQFGLQFGPSDSDIQAIQDWLSSQGFADLKLNNGRTLIEFRGTAGQVRAAFHTEVHHISANGEENFANMQEPQIPRALAPVVAGVAGLHNFHPKPQLRRLGKFQRNMQTGEITPLFTYTDVNGTFYGVGPSDFATIYNLPTSLNANKPGALDGSGVSIAVVGQTNVNLQDITDFRHIFGLDSSFPPNNVQVILNGPDPGLVSGDEGESDLDLEVSGAVAPAANIIFVTSQQTQTDGLGGVDSSAEYIVDNNVAPILSMSYGNCEANLGAALNLFYQLLWQQANAEGITPVISAGDNGSAGCDDQNAESVAGQTGTAHGVAVSGIASTPYNVALGGTDINQADVQPTYWNTCTPNPSCSTAPPTTPTTLSVKGYIPEMPWNESCAASGLTGCASVTVASSASNIKCPSCIVGGSGGPSSIYPRPAWQSSAITGMFSSDGKRDLPDLSLFSSSGANKSFYIVCESDNDIVGDTGCNLTKFVGSGNGPVHDFQAVGGTSAAAPSFAGIMALIVQNHGRQGNANVELYALAKAPYGTAACDSGQGTSGSSSNTTCVFNDITPNKAANGNTPTLNNSVPCAGGTTNCSNTTSGQFGVLASGSSPAFNTGVGYDMATGLGTPNVTNLINAWTTPAATGSTPTASPMSPASVNGVAGVVSVNLTGSFTGAPMPTGVVILENAATNAPVASAQLDGSGNYTIAAALLPLGNYSVKAHYSGDANYKPADSSTNTAVSLSQQPSKVTVSFVTFTNANPPQSILSTSPSPVQYGSPYILRVDVAGTTSGSCTNSSGTVKVCPKGTISLKNGAAPLNDFPVAQNHNATNVANLNDRGFAEDQPIQLVPGSYSISASYTADSASSYASQAGSNTLSVTINQASTTTTVVPSTTTITAGQSVTLTANVATQSNSSQGPTGTVQFFNGGVSLGTAANCAPTGANPNGTGSAVFASCTATLNTSISALPPGFLDPGPRSTPFIIFAWLAAALAFLSFLLAARLAAGRRRYAYASVAFFVIAAAALAGCGGGGGGGGSPRSLTATFTSTNTNYTGSTSAAATITVH